MKKMFLIVCYSQSRIAFLSLLACAETKCVPAAPALGLGCETVHPLRAPNAALGGAKTAATAGSLARTASDLAALLRLANVEVGFSRGLHDTRGVLLPSLRHSSTESELGGGCSVRVSLPVVVALKSSATPFYGLQCFL